MGRDHRRHHRGRDDDAVALTGNHYWLDGVVGVIVAALAVLFERRVHAAITRRRRVPAPEASRALPV